MNKPLSTLSDDEIRQIAVLVETLEHSSFDFLQVESGDLKLTLGKGAPPAAAFAAQGAPPVHAPQAPAATVPAAALVAAPEHSAAAAPADGTVAIVAPMMGRFYAKPEPGAAAFVTVGAQVDAETTVCLIEVMKVFTAVRADLRGVVTEICVRDEQFVEYGQVLFRLRAG
ncbi:MAG: acetyl-CoA carboxylase, biotin carboxyl carrier protein [Betaproteobacteria bacterium]|nr:acetyl-CoA carboxylase, biotin carboxyl carrier protein [Betaproteobacteria bacterium]